MPKRLILKSSYCDHQSWELAICLVILYSSILFNTLRSIWIFYYHRKYVNAQSPKARLEDGKCICARWGDMCKMIWPCKFTGANFILFSLPNGLQTNTYTIYNSYIHILILKLKFELSLRTRKVLIGIRIMNLIENSAK